MAAVFPPNDPFISDKARAKALGSGKNCAHHWLSEKIATAAALPLGLLAFIDFWVFVANDPSYANVSAWLRLPWNALLLFFALFAGTLHCRNGLIIVIDDYVHHPVGHRLLCTAVQWLATLFITVAAFALLKISLA